MKKLTCTFLLFFFLHNSVISAQEKTVFLTGSCGFIGSNFLTYMFNKHPDYRFIVLDALTYAGSMDNIPQEIQDSERFEFFYGSVVNPSEVNNLMSRSDFVVHFAAETHVTRSLVDDYLFVETDVLGTRAKLAALVKNRDKVQRFIHISTSEVYGTTQGSFIDEKHLLNPRSPYAAAKAAADRLVYAYNCTYDLPAVIVRPFNNYGPRQHLEKMVPRFISSAIKGELLTIHGDGSQTRDWIFVEDCCEALDQILHAENFEQLKHQEINIASGKETSVLDMAKTICQLFNLSEDHIVFLGNRPGQVESQIANAQKAKKLLGWSPKTCLEDGLAKTVSWYLDNPAFCQKCEVDATLPIQTVKGIIEKH